MTPTNRLVLEEKARGAAKFGPYSSPHEAVAVIREEYLELEREVFEHGDVEDVIVEAIQLSAVSMRFAEELRAKVEWEKGDGVVVQEESR